MVGLALLLAVSACDDNPLAEDRETASYFRLNPSSVAVNAGGTVVVDANILNRYGAALDVPVTATPCDTKLSVETDTTRSAFEYPERFVISGETLGMSCLIVSASGVTDSINVRVIPASMTIALADAIIDSGETVSPNATYFTTTGGTVTGLTLSDLSWTSLTPNGAVVDEDGNVTGRAPGTARILVGLGTEFSATRVDTLVFEVEAGAFTGTLSANSGAAGSMVTVGAGAYEFDEDTKVLIDGVETFIHRMTPTSMEVVVGTVAEPGTETQFVISNMGEEQIAAIAPFTVTTNVDPWEPNNGLATAIPAAIGDTIYFASDADDFSELVRLDLAAATDVDVQLDWFPGATDMDVYFYTSAGAYDGDKGDCATSSNPEHCVYNLSGTWYLRPYNWEQDEERPATIVRLIITRDEG